MKNSKFFILIRSLYFFSLFIIVLFFVCESFIEKPAPIFFAKHNAVETLTLVSSDNSRTEITLPQNISADGNGLIVLETTLPSNIKDNTYISLKSACEYDIYINSVLRYSFVPDAVPLPGGIVKNVISFVKLSPYDFGKTVQISFHPVKKHLSVKEILIGDSRSLVDYYFRKNAVLFFMAVIILLISIAFTVISFISQKLNKSMLIISPASGIAASLSLWIIFDSELCQFFFNNYYIDGPMSFLCLLASVLPFVHFINRLQEARYLSLFRVLSVISVSVMVIFTILHFTSVLSFLDAQMYMFILIILIWCAAVSTLGIDLIKGFAREYIEVFIGLVVFIISFIVDSLSYHLHFAFSKGYLSIGGLTVLLLTTLFYQLKIVNQRKASELKQIADNEAQNNFFANLSHEFRTPLNSIMGMNELVIRETDDQAIREYALKIDDSGKMLANIISNMLDFSKLNVGNITLNSENYSLQNLLSNVAETIEYRARERELGVSIEIKGSIPMGLTGDGLRLRQLLINVLYTSIDNTSKGKITFTISHKDHEDPQKTNLIFEIRDTGAGIPQKDLPNIFNYINPIDSSSINTDTGSNTGFNLYIAKKLADAMSGDIEVSSVVGIGSVFTISIPQTISDPTPITSLDNTSSIRRSRKSNYKPSFTAPRARILIVDDNRVNIAILDGLLKETQMTIHSVTSGKECLKICSKNQYDIILMDHMMPDMNGIETMVKLKHDCPLNKGAKVIMVTANALSDFRDECIQMGCCDFVSKPVDNNEFEACIAKHLPADMVLRA